MTRINNALRYQQKKTGLAPDTITLSEILQDFQEADRVKIHERYRGITSATRLYKRPRMEKFKESMPDAKGDAELYICIRPTRFQERNRIQRHLNVSIPKALKEACVSRGLWQVSEFRSWDPWNPNEGVNPDCLDFFLRVVNQTADPKRKRYYSRYRVHWLRVPPMADHARIATAVGWTYGVHGTVIDALPLKNRT